MNAVMGLTLFSVAVLLTSIGAGAVGAILGLGGGILLIPILTVFYGVDLHYAMGASIISVIATSSGAAASYLRAGLSNLRIGLFLVMATISGALVGALLAGVVPVRALELILGLALSYSAYTTVKQLHEEVPESPPDDPLALRFDLEGIYHDLRLERDLVHHAFHLRGAASSETVEGIRALAVDKDHAPRWQPAGVAEIDPAEVAAFFVSPWPPEQHPLRDL